MKMQENQEARDEISKKILNDKMFFLLLAKLDKEF